MNKFEKQFYAIFQVQPEEALQTAHKLLNLITSSKSFKTGYKLISFYGILNLHDSMNTSKDLTMILNKIQDAVKAQIGLIDTYNELALFDGLFQIRAKRFHNAVKLHCPLRLHPDALDAMC